MLVCMFKCGRSLSCALEQTQQIADSMALYAWYGIASPSMLCAGLAAAPCCLIPAGSPGGVSQTVWSCCGRRRVS